MLSKILIVSGLVFMSCLAYKCGATQSVNQDNVKNTMKSIGSMEQKYYFEMDADTLSKFKEKAGRIKIGDSKEIIIAALGKPTNEKVLAKKENDEIALYVLEYYIKKRRCCTNQKG